MASNCVLCHFLLICASRPNSQMTAREALLNQHTYPDLCFDSHLLFDVFFHLPTGFFTSLHQRISHFFSNSCIGCKGSVLCIVDPSMDYFCLNKAELLFTLMKEVKRHLREMQQGPNGTVIGSWAANS